MLKDGIGYHYFFSRAFNFLPREWKKGPSQLPVTLHIAVEAGRLAVAPSHYGEWIEMAGRGENSMSEVDIGNKSKNRNRDVQNWKENRRKALHNSGKECTSRSGKVIPSKKLENVTKCQTTYCLYNTLSQEKKEKISCDFYKLSSYNLQNSYLFGLIEGNNCRKAYKKDRVHPDVSQRKNTFTHFVKDPESGHKVQLCKTSFCTVHGTSSRRLRTCRCE
jgi:hypothetical protein